MEKKLIAKCVCCGSDVTELVGEIQPFIRFAGRILDTPLAGGTLVRCRICNVSFRYPQLDKASLDNLYRQGISSNWQTAAIERADWQIAGNWLSLNLKPASEVLDIGCFDGGFLNSLDKSLTISGIEIHEEAAKRARQLGIHIVGNDFANLENLEASFDAVTAFDVIEHSQNPLEFMVQMVSLTKNGGCIIISTGNSDALSWKMLGSRYWYCTIGEHISFINPSWCEWAAQYLGLELKQVTKFTHGHSSWINRAGELLKNLLYVIFPKGFSLLRQLGIGGVEFRKHQVMLKHPPSWMTAKDHFVCIFRKNV